MKSVILLISYQNLYKQETLCIRILKHLCLIITKH